MGVLSVAQLREYRGYFWVIAAIGTALVTPPDAGSMIMLLMVVGGLYEIGIVAAQVFVKHTKAPDTDSETEVAKP
jgi:sec-independent protein translocase protein TatC